MADKEEGIIGDCDAVDGDAGEGDAGDEAEVAAPGNEDDEDIEPEDAVQETPARPRRATRGPGHRLLFGERGNHGWYSE